MQQVLLYMLKYILEVVYIFFYSLNILYIFFPQPGISVDITISMGLYKFLFCNMLIFCCVFMCAPYSDIIFVLFYCFDFFFVFNLPVHFNDVHIFVKMTYKQYWFVIKFKLTTFKICYCPSCKV